MGPQGTKIGSAYIEVTARDEKFRQRIRETELAGRRAADGMRQSFQKMDMEAKNLTSGVNGLKASLIALGGALVFNEMNKLADTFSLMRSRIRLVTKEGEDLFAIEDKLAKQAITNRADLKSTVDLYTRLRQTRSDLSDEATRELVDRWSKTLIISASSAQEAASSTLQFSQAMAAGVLAGQELRSVIQGNSAFAVYLAEALGVTTGQLKKMGEEGKLTTDVIFEGIQRVGDHIEHDFSKKALTIGQAMTNMETAVVRLVGSLDQAMGGSQGMAGWINMLAGAIEQMTMFVRGTTPEIERMAAQTDRLMATIRSTDEQIAKGGMKKLGDDAKDALLPLSEVDNKIASINAKLANTGRLERMDALSRQEAENLDQYLEVQRLEGALADYLRPQLGRAGEFGGTQGTPQQIAKARAELDRAQKVYADGLKRLEEIRKSSDEPFRPAVAKEALDLLQVQLQLELARARGNEKEAARLEDVIMREKLIAEFKQKGLTTEEATAKAAGHVAQLRRAINSENEKERKRAEEEASLRFQLAIAEAEGNKQKVADLETQLEINRRIIELEEQGVAIDQARAQATDEVLALRQALSEATEKELQAARELRDIEFQIALAAAQGDRQREDALKRELEIRRTMKDLIDLGYGADQARAIATYRVDSLVSDDNVWATFEQRVADATKYGFMNAVETGDWGEAFGQILVDITREALSNALDVLWQALAQVDWGGQGQGWAGFFNMVGGSFKPRASGGPVSAGDLYRVGEKGSEWFIPKVDGYILPNDFKGRSLGSPMAISIPTQLIVNGNADGMTRREIAETLDAFARGVPAMIDARVRDRRKRGAY